MGKYGIGARVRDCEGDLAEIIDKRKGQRQVHYDDQQYGDTWWAKAELTPIAGKFKVGDRVRATDFQPQGEVGTIHSIGDDGFYLVAFDTWRDGHKGDGQLDDNRGWHMQDDHLELVAETKFPPVVGMTCVTRDGRRAGPVTFDEDCGCFAAEVHGERVRLFNDDGAHRFGETNLDLVGEWVEPAVAGIKKGDRVLILHTDYPSVAGLQVGDIAYVTDVSGLDAYLSATPDRTGYYFLEPEFTAAPTDFQVGDVVRRTKPSHRPSKYGETGRDYTALSVGPSGIVVVAGADGARFDSFELVRRPPAQPPAPKFAPGVTVKIIGDSRGHAWLAGFVGQTLVIKAKDGLDGTPGWSLVDHGYWWPETDLEVVASAQPPANDKTVTIKLDVDSAPFADALRTIAAALSKAANDIAA